MTVHEHETQPPVMSLEEILEQRFGERVEVPAGLLDADQRRALAAMASRASHRQWAPRAVDPALTRLLVAVALCAPSKSDLQQTEVIEVSDAIQRSQIQALVPSMPWMSAAPLLLVVCGSGARLRRVFERAHQPFANEHLDGLFNPTTDAAMVLMNFLAAAGAAGLVGVPVSVLRDQAQALAGILALPRHVFPVAGVCLGYPDAVRDPTPRFALSASLHRDRHGGGSVPIDEALLDFDDRYQAFRQARTAPAAVPSATWSTDKTRQYARAQRADWGAFLREQGFILD
jgi:nitroreductase